MRRMPVNDWSEFKQLIARKTGCNLQASEMTDRYDIVLPDGLLSWEITLLKGSADCDDFEEVYLDLCNYSSGINLSPFATDDYSAAFDFATPQECVNDTLNLDVKINASNLYVNGGKLVATNLKLGDWIEIQVADKDGIYTPPGTVLKTWGKLLLDPNGGNEIALPYAGQPLYLSYMRVVLHKAQRNEGEANPVAGITFYLHAQEV